ncbi:MAG: thiolase family protein [Dehalococcoidales bacterium]|jgi:acetyl-CoA acetyltransferase
MTIKDKYAFVGVGLTRLGKVPEMTPDELAAQAINLALADAGLKPADVDGYIYQQGMGGGLSDTVPLQMMGINASLVWQVASLGSYANNMVAMAIGAMESGLCHTCILVYASSAASRRGGGMMPMSPFSTPGAYGWYGPGATAACMAQRYMHLYGLKREQLGAIAVTLREYANRRPDAIMHDKKITLDDYLNARMVVEPLCLLDFCLVNDGAVALIITSKDRAKNCKKRPVYVMGYGVDHSLRELNKAPEAIHHFDGFIAEKAKEQAFKTAGITLQDIDVAEIYDAFTIFLLSQLESYGICKKGEAGAFVAAGNLKLNGSFPSNTSGTGLSWGYLMGFTQLTEGIKQMRGEGGACQIKDAEICLVTGLGGMVDNGSAATCTILRR